MTDKEYWKIDFPGGVFRPVKINYKFEITEKDGKLFYTDGSWGDEPFLMEIFTSERDAWFEILMRADQAIMRAKKEYYDLKKSMEKAGF